MQRQSWLQKLRAPTDNPTLNRVLEVGVGFFITWAIITLLNGILVTFKTSVGQFPASAGEVSSSADLMKFLIAVALSWLQQTIIILFVYFLLLHGIFVTPGMGKFPYFLGGLALGFGTLAITAAISWIAGLYQIVGLATDVRPFPEPVWAFLASMVSSFGAGFFEEIFLRAFLLNAIYWGIGRIAPQTGTFIKLVVAIFLSSLAFGLVHPADIVLLAFLAGIMFAVAYRTRRSLWIAIGFHFAWDLGVAIGATNGGTPVVFQSKVTLSSGYMVLQAVLLICFIVALILTRAKHRLDHVQA